jgi:hypothetical protein
MRFLLEDERPLSFDMITTGLREVDPGFALAANGDLTRGEQLLAELDINLPGDGLFEDEVSELCEVAEDAGGSEVAARLRSITAIVAARVLWQGRSTEDTMDMLSPLWDWLTTNRRGLIQADAEGFYDEGELVLETG